MKYWGASAELIGRQDELAELEARLAGAEGGEPGVVVLSGEAGVGKSRLLGAFAQRAAARARVLIGGCVDLSEGGLPFAPVVEVFRRLSRDLDAQRMAEVLGTNRFELARLVPQLSSERVTPTERMASGSQSTLFSAVLDAFENLAGEQPLVVGVEDLHWAGQSTLAMLTYLAGNLRGVPALFVATLRTDELHHPNPLRPQLAELGRMPTVARMELAPFDRNAVAAQIAGLTGEKPEPAVVDEIAARSDGNPFFVEELIAARKTDGAADPPQSLRDVLLSPLDGLPKEARQLVDVVAAVGRPVGHRLLGAVTGYQGAELSDLLRPAVHRSLLVEDGDARYGFRHALTREAVYDELLASERIVLHHTIAVALTAHRHLADSENVDAELAHHWNAAEAFPEAFAASLAAGERSRQMGAHEAALGHYERALALWDHRDEAAPARLDVLLAGAEAAHRAGAYRQEAAHLQAAMAENSEPEALQEADLRRRLALALSRLGELEAAHQQIERARDLVLDAPHCSRRAYVLAWYARSVLVTRSSEEAIEPAQEALRAARAVEPRHPEAKALTLLGDGLCARNQWDEGLARLQQALGIAVDLDDTDLLTWAYNDLLLALVTAQRHDEAQALTERALAWLHDGADRDPATALLTAKVAWQLLAVGEWQRAERLLARTARQSLTGLRRVELHEVRALLHLYQGSLDAADRDLAEAHAAGATSDRQSARPWFTLETILATLAGDPDAAREASEAAGACEPVWEIDTHPLVHVVRAEVGAALAASDTHRRTRLRRARDTLTELQRQQREAAQPFTQRWGWQRDALRAQAELSRLECPEPEQWRALLVGETHSYWRVHDRYGLAEALLATGHHEEAAVELARGHAEACHLGADQLRDQLEDLARRGGVALPGVEPGAAAIPELTPREREVLRLVAQGHTNQEIAEALYIAPKTASTHLSHILDKLGVANRVQAAAVAHRHGLGDPEPASIAAAEPAP